LGQKQKKNKIENNIFRKYYTIQKILHITYTYINFGHVNNKIKGKARSTSLERKSHYIWKKPGACHHARWMPNILYCCKMYAFKQQTAYSQETNENIEKICKFICLYYIKPWLLAGYASEAPTQDIKLINNLYDEVDLADIAHETLKCFQNQAWYLCEELIPLCLFGQGLTVNEKVNVAKQLYKYVSKGKCMEKGQPIFPKFKKNCRLEDLVGKKSCILFEIMQSSYEWLQTKPTEWNNNEDYKRMETFIENLKVVNDPAERAIKLISDFKDSITDDEKQKQFLIQVVEENRRLLPDFNKQDLVKAISK
jgi:hypothetical protein